MRTLTIRRIEGKRVPDPATGRQISADRDTVVPRTTHWLRRVADGDVELRAGGDETEAEPSAADVARARAAANAETAAAGARAQRKPRRARRRASPPPAAPPEPPNEELSELDVGGSPSDSPTE